MITFSGWLFIVFALLSFTQLGVLNSGLERQFGLASTAMLLAMGIGLLLRRNWARWLALGLTLLTWTLGSLALLWGVVTLLKVSFGSARVPLSVYVGGMFVVVLLGAYIWLNVRLFERLTSDEGRKEFRTPFTERYAVVKSTA